MPASAIFPALRINMASDIGASADPNFGASSDQDMSSAPPKRNAAARAFHALERAFDGVFGAAENPLRQLGALGFYLFWIVTVSGIYVYVFFDTSIEGAFRSLDALAREQPYAGGLMRSLHRYASDAFALVVALHLARELAYGRFTGFRWFSWVSGVPLIWLGLAAGIGGYWLVWDSLAQVIGIATTEWFGWLPGFGPTMVRNFLVLDTLTDRLFSLLVFMHIGIPLLLLLGMWVHIQRITEPRTSPGRRAGVAMLAAMLALCVAAPALSQAPADLASVPAELPLDWFYLFALPLVYRTSPGELWTISIAVTLALTLLPWMRPRFPSAPAAAEVDLAYCNGCSRCVADCPYGAVVMLARTDGRNHPREAHVLPDLCASCGICAGACPSSTPFRSVAEFRTGIDMPASPMGGLRDRLEHALAGLQGEQRTVVFACACGADARALAQPGVAVLSLPCIGMLPPSFVEYALRSGAEGVLVGACAEGDCEFNSGEELTRARLAGEREPHLRASVARERLRLVRCADAGELLRALAGLRSGSALHPGQSPLPRRQLNG